jgi:hypothetical protein
MKAVRSHLPLFREAQEFVEKVDELINKRFKTKKPNRF